MSYKKLDVWNIAREVIIEIHNLSMGLPKYELYEMGSQIRRSSKSVKANIVEGFGRRRYKNDFIRFLVYALASTDETKDHLETLYDTKSIKDKDQFDSIHEKLEILGKKLINLIKAVETKHK